MGRGDGGGEVSRRVGRAGSVMLSVVVWKCKSLD